MLQSNNKNETEYLNLCLEMRDFANTKYLLFQELWTQFDIPAVIFSIVISFWLFIHFFFYGVLDPTIKISWLSFGMMAFFYGNILVGFNVIFGYEYLSWLMIIISCFFMIELDVTSGIKIAKGVQNQVFMFISLLYIIMQFSDVMVTEADSMMDNFLIVILVVIY